MKYHVNNIKILRLCVAVFCNTYATKGQKLQCSIAEEHVIPSIKRLHISPVAVGTKFFAV